MAHWAQRRTIVGTCVRCGAAFRTAMKNRLYCTACRAKRDRELQEVSRRRRRTLTEGS